MSERRGRGLRTQGNVQTAQMTDSDRGQHSVPRSGVLLIDDDPAFCKIVTRFAVAGGIPIDVYGSLAEMGTFARLGRYDVALLDYDLGTLDGIEIAEYVEIFFSHVPVVLISSTNLEASKEKIWPTCIRRFVHKDRGVDAILGAAVDVARSAERIPGWAQSDNPLLTRLISDRILN